MPELRPGIPAGYLGRAAGQLGAAAATTGPRLPAFANDQAIHRAAQKLRGALRAGDHGRKSVLPAGGQYLLLRAWVPISQQTSPTLYLLLQRTLVDAGLATYAAKDHYKRTRPFVFYKDGACAPAEETSLRTDGSYPYGHTAFSWTWALLLTELSPDHAHALLARGRAFGENLAQ